MRVIVTPVRALLMALVWAGVASPVFAQGDQFNTSGGGGNIVADAHAWWANPTGHTDEFRTQTGHCLSLLDEAEGHRLTAMDYKTRAKAKGPMSSAERTRLNRLGNEEYAIVTRLVRQFYVCARPTSDQFRTGTGRQQPARQQPQPGRRDRIDTEGDPRPQPAPQRPQPGRRDQIDTEGDRRPQPAPQQPQQGTRDEITTRGDCLPVPAPRLRGELHAEGMNALQTMAACGSQCDAFQTMLGKLAAARLLHLTQSNEGIAARTARTVPAMIENASRAVARYFVNDNAANHRRLLAQAQAAIAQADQALKMASRNPAASLAYVADEVLWSRVTTGATGVCEATAVRVRALAREVDDARQAVQVARQIEARERAVARNNPTLRCGGPFGSGGGMPPRRNPLEANPTGGRQNCVAVAIAGAKIEATGARVKAPDILPTDEAPTYGGVFKLLRENFGDEVFPELKPFEQKLQAAGVPRVLEKSGIEAELRAAAEAGIEKPQGIVFITGANGAQGHAFNAVWDNGRVVYKDYQVGVVGQTSFDVSRYFGSAADTYFYRVQ